jgi:hypothetical protein
MTTESRFPGLNMNGSSPPQKPREKRRKANASCCYFRIPDPLKAALDAYCEQEATSMTVAIQTALKMMLTARQMWPPHPTNNKPMPGLE